MEVGIDPRVGLDVEVTIGGWVGLGDEVVTVWHAPSSMLRMVNNPRTVKPVL
jgi:hypothetical protein